MGAADSSGTWHQLTRDSDQMARLGANMATWQLWGTGGSSLELQSMVILLLLILEAFSVIVKSLGTFG